MWPTPQDYNEALQNPRLCFGDEELRNTESELDRLGLPKAVCGSFASVYHVRNGNRELAVRCFLHHFADQEERYRAISNYVGQRWRHCGYAVGFQYLPQGIQVNGHWFPLLKMDWVHGTPLTAWVSQHCRDAAGMQSLANQFVDICKDMASSGIAHGDLQHGNILVTPSGQIKIVDYDAMFVPALSGLSSHEIGHRHYQHPHRTKEHFGPYLDNFSAWSIYTSLFCLMRDPSLIYTSGCADEGLLFRQADYLQPQLSPVFERLESHDDPAIRDAAIRLGKILCMNVEDVPALDVPSTGSIIDVSADNRTSNTAPICSAPPPMEPPAVLKPIGRINHKPSKVSLGTIELAALLVTLLVLSADAFVHHRAAPVTPSRLPIDSSLLNCDDMRAAAQFQNEGHYASAISKYASALSTFTSARNERGQATCSYLIGACHHLMGHDPLAIDWLTASSGTYRCESYIKSVDADLGCLLADNGQLNAAVPYLERALLKDVPRSWLTGEIASEKLKTVAVKDLDNKQLDGLEAFRAAVAYERAHGIDNSNRDVEILQQAASRLEQSTEPELAHPVSAFCKNICARQAALANPRRPSP